MRKAILLATAALTLGLGLLAPQTSLAAARFYGIVRHVSANSIKVDDPRTNQTLSFEVSSGSVGVFSGDGKTTYRLSDVRPGRYVGIIYDQKRLGIRFADEIYLLTNRDDRIRRP
jgi:hypothetical protein